MVKKLEVEPSELKEGDMVNGEIVDCVKFDIGMAVVYYKSGNYKIFHKKDKVKVVRREEICE